MEKVILGIDPGSRLMGYGVLACEGKKFRLIDLGTLNFSKIADPMERMQEIFKETCRLIQEHQPSEVAFEAPFHGKNVQSMLKLGRAQGIAIAAALHHNLSVYEYAPRKVKQSITGRGAATKDQVAAILKALLKLDELPQHLDATDGLAVALCHYFQNNLVVAAPVSNPLKAAVAATSSVKKKVGSWETFVAQNAERVR